MKRLAVFTTLTLAVLAASGSAAATPTSMTTDAPNALAFTCDLTFPVSPSPTATSGASDCVGRVLVGGDGGTGSVCVEGVGGCEFRATVDSYHDLCPAGYSGPSLAGFANGEMYVNGGFIGTYNWVQVGTEIWFVDPGTIRGHGTFHKHDPIPTCAFPGPLTATITGTLYAP